MNPNNDPSRDPMTERSTCVIWLVCALVLLGTLALGVCRAVQLAAVVPPEAWRFDATV